MVKEHTYQLFSNDEEKTHTYTYTYTQKHRMKSKRDKGERIGESEFGVKGMQEFYPAVL